MQNSVKNIYHKAWLGFLLSIIVGCSSTDSIQPPDSASQPADNAIYQDKKDRPLRSAEAYDPSGTFDYVYDAWKGTPYRLGGTSKRGIDCSAFVQVGYFSVYDKMLPRTTSELVKLGQSVSVTNAKEGDLVFFKTGYRLRHVGIYLGNSEFLHASTSQGVIISRLDNPYWRRAFWQVRRIN
ncbi:NlpC/P60 family protein [Photobacterium lipolyticum]|uniref:NlpC/P60 domain-containing protein n=1 Tax=Photobacterium lipolyticum TaxID=266810 RepID=A0A2T3MYW5_9GAMM|nr:NlpC/P60 family protein [Photobacterium lipolyticum]PSW05186.1 hypothetical protein C9I89_10390 [Photobacterium lipolyticum]